MSCQSPRLFVKLLAGACQSSQRESSMLAISHCLVMMCSLMVLIFIGDIVVFNGMELFSSNHVVFSLHIECTNAYLYMFKFYTFLLLVIIKLVNILLARLFVFS
jgi:acyl-CoA synthetase (AMP-forming)/AMP-acid ligase II